MAFLLWNCKLIAMITLSCCCIRSRASLFASALWHHYSYKERQKLCQAGTDGRRRCGCALIQPRRL